MSDPVTGNSADANSQSEAPPGRCGACGYVVHLTAGLICPECGADLRKSGIITGELPRHAGVKRVFWLLMFAALWAVVCLTICTMLFNQVFEHLWPYRVNYQSIYRLYPRDGNYQNIVIASGIRGVVHGRHGEDAPLKELTDKLKYEVTATLNSADGASVLHVDPLSNMAWNYNGGAGGAKSGNAALNKAAILDWLKAAGRDTSQPSAQREADELFFIFDGLKTEVEAGYSYNRFNAGRGIAYWAEGFRKGAGEPPPFSGLAQSTYMSPPGGLPPEALPTLGAAIPWAAGVWWWLRRMRRGAKIESVKSNAGAAPEKQGSAASVVRDGAESPQVSHRLLSILFSDVKDYTSRSAMQPRAGVMNIVRQHRERVIPVVKKHRGRVIKQMGDGILCVFDSATDAVLAGLEIQHTPLGRAAQASALEMRIAISTGEVTVEADDVFGPAVNLASRVQQLAGAGEVFFTETTFGLLNAMEVSASEVGTFDLKGVPLPVRVYRAVAAVNAERS